MSLWQAFRTQPLSKTVTPSAVEYRFTADGNACLVVIPKRRANARTVLHCENGYLEWEQLPLFPKLMGQRVIHGERRPLYRFTQKPNETVIVAVKGCPGLIVGADEGDVRSAARFAPLECHLMRYREFKRL